MASLHLNVYGRQLTADQQTVHRLIDDALAHHRRQEQRVWLAPDERLVPDYRTSAHDRRTLTARPHAAPLD